MDKKIYFTPGPSQLSEGVSDYIKEAIDNDICSISHRSEEFKDIYKKADMGVRGVLNVPDDYQVFFLSSATEAMERVVQNCVLDKSFHLVGGVFGNRFYQTAIDYGKHAHIHKIESDKGFSIKDADIPEGTEVICVTQCETSTGGIVPNEVIRSMYQSHPDTLTILDAVSGVPHMDIDWSVTHGAFLSVQKGFGLPAGLGVVILSPCAIERHRFVLEGGGNIGSYHSFESLLKNAEKKYTPETPNVLNLYLLGRVCDDMLEKGISIIREETREKMQLLTELVESTDKLSFYIKDAHFRSETVVVLDVIGKVSDLVKDAKEHGIVISIGYGEMKDTQIRIANFTAHTVDDIKKLVAVFKNII